MLPPGPTGAEDPVGFTTPVNTGAGWPDEGLDAADPTTGVTASVGPNNATLTSVGLPSGLAGGYATVSKDANIPAGSPSPSGFYGEGIKILSNTATQVVLESPIGDGLGEQEVTITAAMNNQVLFTLGVNNIAVVMSVERVAPATDGAVDATVVGHNLATGNIGIGALAPAVMAGEDIKFVVRRAFSGGIPAGLGFSLQPPRAAAPPTALTVGLAWSVAYGDFFAQGVPAPTPGSYQGAMDAMRSVMDGFSGVIGMGPVSITAGLTAFWGIVAASAATIWPSLPAVSAVPPPTVFGAGPAIMAVMLPTSVIPVSPPPGNTWTNVRSKADIALLAGAISAVSQGGLVISQPGAAPVPVPFVLA